GHYSEQDIREAARAFTGWDVQDGKGRFNPANHDAGPKTVLGKSGNFTGRDVVRICLDQPSCPYFVAGKLFHFLVSESMPAAPELLEPLAEEFRKSGHDTRRLVERVLRSNVFFSTQAYRSRVKSPVDFAVGVVRALEGNVSTL